MTNYLLGLPRVERDFFMASSVDVALRLLGKHLVSIVDKRLTVGRIIDTEAYPGSDAASHLYGKQPTERTRVQYREAGISYVYAMRGHSIFSIVVGKEGVADVVFIGAIEPLFGIDVMAQRRGKEKGSRDLTSGPGKLCQALGISRAIHGIDICSDNSFVFITEGLHKRDVCSRGTRINLGLRNAKDEERIISLNQQWRFYIKGNKYVRIG